MKDTRFLIGLSLCFLLSTTALADGDPPAIQAVKVPCGEEQVTEGESNERSIEINLLEALLETDGDSSEGGESCSAAADGCWSYFTEITCTFDAPIDFTGSGSWSKGDYPGKLDDMSEVISQFNCPENMLERLCDLSTCSGGTVGLCAATGLLSKKNDDIDFEVDWSGWWPWTAKGTYKMKSTASSGSVTFMANGCFCS